MSISIPNKGIIQASAQNEILFPKLQRDNAIEAVANYLRMLRDWTQTRFAVAGDGVGNVAISNRNSYIYARLGSAAGEVIEAKLINLLELQNNDPLLVRRENPGAAGGWIVIDAYGASIHLRYCTFDGGILWTLFNSVWKIDALVSSEVTNPAPGMHGLRLGAPQDALLVLDGNDPLSYLYRSTDSGASFSQVLETHETSREQNPEYGTILDFDRLNRELGYNVSFLSILGADGGGGRLPQQTYVDAVLNQWYPPAAGTYALSVQETDLDYFFEGMTVYVSISTDGGAAWTEYALDNLGELIPSRIESVGYVVGQTQYESFGCVLTTSGNPFGIPAVIVEDAPPNSRLYFAVCDETYDPADPESNGLPFVQFPNIVGKLCIAAKQDGSGCYAFVETMHIGPQTDLGEYQSPWSPNGGNPLWVGTQWIWNINTAGSATRKEISLGTELSGFSFDGTDTAGNVRALQKAVVNPTNTNQIFALVMRHIGDPDVGDFYFGVDDIDFDAGTMTSTSAPFESDATLDALDIVCAASGTVFVYVVQDDHLQASIWKWDGTTWTETDVTVNVDSGGFVGGGRFAYSQVDTKLYLVCNTQIVGETTDDGTTWTFSNVTGDVFGLNDVDTY